jgi:hypothetical protein
MAAVVTLLGGLFAASLTLVGVLLKHSVDNRNAALAKEAEARLRLEAAIRAVDLLATSSGDPAPVTRQAGALFTLSALGQLELALSLLEESWPRGGVSSSAAAHIIDSALVSDDPRHQVQAANMLRTNAALLPELDARGAHLPSSMCLAWPSTTQFAARTELLYALLECLLSRKSSWWFRDFVNFVVVELNLIRGRDPDDRIVSGASYALRALLDCGRRWSGTLDMPEGALVIAELSDELARGGTLTPSDELTTLSDRIRNSWFDGEPR